MMCFKGASTKRCIESRKGVPGSSSTKEGPRAHVEGLERIEADEGVEGMWCIESLLEEAELFPNEVDVTGKETRRFEKVLV